MSTQTDAYMYWIDNKKCLEEIINRRKALTNPEQLTADNLIRAQSGLRRLQDEIIHLQKTCGGDLPPSSYREIKEANHAFEEIVEVLSQRRKEYLSLAPQIKVGFKRWHNSTEANKEGELTSVMELCSKYRCAADLDPELFPGKTQLNQFYADMSELAFIASPQMAEKYLKQYAQLTSVDEVIKFKHEFEHDFWQKADGIKHKLKQRPENRLSNEELTILDASPLEAFTQIKDDIEKVTENSAGFQKVKRELWQEIITLRDDFVYLSNNSPALNQTYVDKVVIPNNVTAPATDYLLLKKDLADFHQLAHDLKKLKEDRKKELTELAKTECSELTKTITANINSHNYTRLSNYADRAMELKEYCERLGESNTVKLLQDQFDWIDRISKYVTATQLTKKRELNITVGEYELKPQIKDVAPNPNQKPIDAIPNKDIPWMSIVKEQDLAIAGARYSRYTQDSSLKQLCLQIAGINEKGEYSCTTLKDRVGSIDKQKFGKVGEKLLGDDAIIYIALREGISKSKVNYK